MIFTFLITVTSTDKHGHAQTSNMLVTVRVHFFMYKVLNFKQALDERSLDGE